MSQSAQTTQPAMELRGVSVSFGSVRALQDIDIKVYPGEVHCLLGDNGAGKSTLIKVLSGVHRPTRGEIFVDGKPVVFRSPRDAQDLVRWRRGQDVDLMSGVGGHLRHQLVQSNPIRGLPFIQQIHVQLTRCQGRIAIRDGRNGRA